MNIREQRIYYRCSAGKERTEEKNWRIRKYLLTSLPKSLALVFWVGCWKLSKTTNWSGIVKWTGVGACGRLLPLRSYHLCGFVSERLVVSLEQLQVTKASIQKGELNTEEGRVSMPVHMYLFLTASYSLTFRQLWRPFCSCLPNFKQMSLLINSNPKSYSFWDMLFQFFQIASAKPPQPRKYTIMIYCGITRNFLMWQ